MKVIFFALVGLYALVRAGLWVARRLTSNDSLRRRLTAREASRAADEMADRYHQRFPDRALAIGWLDGKDRRLIARGVDQEARSVDGGTIFELGSVTKTLTGLLLAKAVEDGGIQLETSLEELLPEVTLSDSARKITLQQLANHTSGLPRLPPDLSTDQDKSDPYAHYTRERLLASLANVTTKSSGSPEYSNYGVGLLGEILALRAGLSFGEYIKAQLFEPIGLVSAYVREKGALEEERLIAGFMSGKETPAWTMPGLAGAGGVRMNMDDLVMVLAFFLAPPDDWFAARELAWAAQHRGEPATVGLCWQIKGPPNDPIYWHNGSTYGASSFVAIRPGTGRAVAVIQNQSQLVGMLVGSEAAPEVIGWALIESSE